MTPAEWLVAVTSRGVRVIEVAGRLRIERASLLTSEERAFACANADAMAAALHAPEPARPADDALELDLTLDALLRAEVEAEEARLVPPPPPPAERRFRLGWDVVTQSERVLPLSRLATGDVIRLRAHGRLSDEETRRWLAGRSGKRHYLKGGRP
jgi:hypothetical protein